jgi:hypothetical protein
LVLFIHWRRGEYENVEPLHNSAFQVGMQSLLLLFIYLNCKWGFTRWQCTTIRHNTQITHNPKTIRAHKTDTNNKGYTIHNEYNYNYNNRKEKNYIAGEGPALPEMA